MLCFVLLQKLHVNSVHVHVVVTQPRKLNVVTVVYKFSSTLRDSMSVCRGNGITCTMNNYNCNFVALSEYLVLIDVLKHSGECLFLYMYLSTYVKARDCACAGTSNTFKCLCL